MYILYLSSPWFKCPDEYLLHPYLVVWNKIFIIYISFFNYISLFTYAALLLMDLYNF